MPTNYPITITDDSVNGVIVPPGDTITWTNNASVAVTLTNLPPILSPPPPDNTIQVAVNATTRAYT